MGEAWGDWYGMDFLNNEGFQADTRAPGEVRIGAYVGNGQDLFRTQPMDCPVGTTSTACPGTPGAGPGGYTYGDFGKIIGFPEVHADGEIWGETLWDLRDSIGSRKAELLVTRAMELSPAKPSYLDMRNSILPADQAVYRGSNNSKIWNVFAARGMGWFAGAVDGDDAAPSRLLPATQARHPTGSLGGIVTDQYALTPSRARSSVPVATPPGSPAITRRSLTPTVTTRSPGSCPALIRRSSRRGPDSIARRRW